MTHAAFSEHFYAIRNAATIADRNAAIRRAHRAGGRLDDLASAAGLSRSTVAKVVR